jgi:hypothetical protein
MPKTRRYGTLKKRVKEKVKNMEIGEHFTSKEIYNELHEEESWNFSVQAIASILRELYIAKKLARYQEDQSYIWEKTNVV